ncbi:hypothetical protein HK101_003778 [Irineochytrium annulatum]|nr:hypothetical protein HK101_003778 [Irineochytrium annulatum]
MNTASQQQFTAYSLLNTTLHAATPDIPTTRVQLASLQSIAHHFQTLLNNSVADSVNCLPVANAPATLFLGIVQAHVAHWNTNIQFLAASLAEATPVPSTYVKDVTGLGDNVSDLQQQSAQTVNRLRFCQSVAAAPAQATTCACAAA